MSSKSKKSTGSQISSRNKKTKDDKKRSYTKVKNRRSPRISVTKNQSTIVVNRSSLLDAGSSHPMFDQIYTKIHQYGTVTVSNIVTITTSVMSILQKYPTLSGQDKKNITLSILKKIVTDSNLDTTVTNYLLNTISTVIPGIIDTIIAASKGKLKEQLKNPKNPQYNVRPSFDKLYDRVETMIGTREVTVSNVVMIATSIMSILQRYPSLTGPEKKQLVIDILTKFVTGSKIIPDDSKQIVISMIQLILPTVIDIVASVAKGSMSKLFKSARKCCVG